MSNHDPLQILQENLRTHIHHILAQRLERIPKEFVQGLFVGLEKRNHAPTQEDHLAAEKIIEEMQYILQERTDQYTEHLIKSIDKPLIQLSLLTQKITDQES